MTLQQLQALVDDLREARRPQDVFPAAAAAVNGARYQAVRRQYRRLLKRIHPDRFADDPDMNATANEAVVLLNQWLNRAAAQWGKRRPSSSRSVSGTRVATGHQSWRIERLLQAGDVADDYLGLDEDSGQEVVLRVCRQAVDNDLLDNQKAALDRLWNAPADELLTFGHYVPRLLASFRLPDHRRVDVLDHNVGFVGLDAVCDAYPEGVDSRTFAWMFNRILEALAWVHGRGVVHGAVLPSNVLIHPRSHGGCLLGWELSVQKHGDHWPRLAAVPREYRDWYPPEVFDREPATPALDIYLAAQTLIAISGGDPMSRADAALPRPIRDLLHGCLQADPRDRFDDAFEVYRRFKDILLRLHGPPRYHPFRMP